MKTKTNFDTKKIIGIAVFSAFAYIVALVCNIIPPIAGFLSLDAKDAVISIAALIYGPISGVVISFIAAFIEFITFSTTAWYGFIMNFASSAAFSLTVALIYKFKRTFNGALLGYFVSVIATTGIMLLLNTFVTPIYLVGFVGMPQTVATEQVIDLLPKVLLPFNFAKSLMNSALALMLYKPIVTALRNAGLANGKKGSSYFNKGSRVIILIGTIALAASVAIFIALT